VASRPLVVALRPLWLGDLLTGIPALRALRDRFSDHRVILAAPAVLAPLARLAEAVDDVVSTRPHAALHHSLHGADVAVDLHGRGPASHRVLLETRPRRLVAFEHPAIAESAGLPKWREEEHEVQRWCRLLAESGVPADPHRLGLDPRRFPAPASLAGATLIHPGAKSQARRWPAERFAAVARAEAATGRRVLLTGGAEERALATAVADAAGLPAEAVLAGRTSLMQLAGLVASAGRVVVNDTGVAHLATAFGTPSIILFGPSSPARWGPPPERRRHVALWAGWCGDPHGRDPDPGLLELTVADVLEALDDLDCQEAARSPATTMSSTETLVAEQPLQLSGQGSFNGG
jgi:ADP-heptose:LPS heptosyltransferase